MPSYNILWKMKGLDTYVSVKTDEKSRASVMYNDTISFDDRQRTELGRFFHSGSGQITLDRFCRQLGRIVSADPLLIYYKARELGAKVTGDFSLLMTEKAARDFEQKYAIFTDFSTGIEISNPVLLVDSCSQKKPVAFAPPTKPAITMELVEEAS